MPGAYWGCSSLVHELWVSIRALPAALFPPWGLGSLSLHPSDRPLPLLQRSALPWCSPNLPLIPQHQYLGPWPLHPALGTGCCGQGQPQQPSWFLLGPFAMRLAAPAVSSLPASGQASRGSRIPRAVPTARINRKCLLAWQPLHKSRIEPLFPARAVSTKSGASPSAI